MAIHKDGLVLEDGKVFLLACQEQFDVGELFFEALDLFLKFLHGSHEKIIYIIEDDDHWPTFDLIHADLIERIAQESDFVKLISEHVSVFDVEQIYKEIDLENSSFLQVGRCFDGEGSLANSRLPVEEKDVVLVLFKSLHELIKLLLTTHDGSVGYFLMRLYQFWG